MPRCGDCKYSEELYPADEDSSGRNLCEYPIALLPLSMQGYANRERESVNPENTTCPTWTQKGE